MATPSGGLRRRNVGDDASLTSAAALDCDQPRQEEDDQGRSCCGCLGAIGAVGSAFRSLGSRIYGQPEYRRFGLGSEEELRQASELQQELEGRQEQKRLDAQCAAALEQEGADEELARRLQNEGEEGASGPNSYQPFSASSSSSSSASASLAALDRQRDAAVRFLQTHSEKEGGFPFLYQMPSHITFGVGKGIANMNNSCTIASLLYGMFGATDFFDRLLLVGHKTEDPQIVQIRQALIDIANGLRSKEAFVPGEKLNSLRELVMGESNGKNLQPDEFLDPLLGILRVNRMAGNEFTFFSLPSDRFVGSESELQNTPTIQALIAREENFRSHIRAENLLDSQGANIISSPNNKVLFIQMPQQQRHAFVGEDERVGKAYGAIIPSPRLRIEGQGYRLQSIVANEGEVHSVSYVIKADDTNGNKIYYFNGGGNGNVPSQVIALPGLYELLTGEVRRFSDQSLQAWHRKLCTEAAFLIYVRDDE